MGLYIDIRVFDIPIELREGNYQDDRAYRVWFQSWFNTMWHEKQQRLDSHKTKH